jgi:hypothetical protein
LNRRVIVFEDGSKLYDACFAQDKDILLNPAKGGYSWDILSEFEGNYLELAKFFIELSDANSEDLSVTEEYLFKFFSNLELIVTDITAAKVLNKLMFQPYKSIAADFAETLGVTDKDILMKYSKIRDYLSLRFSCLRPSANGVDEISAAKYAQSALYGEKILFVSCFQDNNAKNLLRLILESETSHSVTKIFSTKTPFKASENCIVNASETDVLRRFDSDDSVICSAAEVSKRTQIQALFKDVPDNAARFAKIRGTEQILLVS